MHNCDLSEIDDILKIYIYLITIKAVKLILWNYTLRLLLAPNKEAWLTYINLTKKIEDIPKVKTILINDVALDLES